MLFYMYNVYRTLYFNNVYKTHCDAIDTRLSLVISNRILGLKNDLETILQNSVIKRTYDILFNLG